MADAPEMRLKLLVDQHQKRVRDQRLAAQIFGKHWQTGLCTDVYLHEDSGTLLPLFAPLRPEWQTSVSGINARMSLSDFTHTSGSWVERTLSDMAGDYVFDLVSDTNEPLVSVSSFAQNEGVFINWFVYGTDQDKHAPLEFGWSDTDSAVGDGSFGFRLSVSGTVEFWKDGVYRATRTISNFLSDQDRAIPDQQTGKWAGVCVFPGFRRNAVLIVSTNGGECYFDYDEIDTSTYPVEVTPAAKFWVYQTEGKMSVQIAKLRAATTSVAISKKVFWSDEPTADQFAGGWREDLVLGDGAGIPATLRVVRFDDTATDYVAGDGRVARVRVELTQSGAALWQLYQACTAYPPVLDGGPEDEAVDIMPFVTELTYDFGEDPETTTLHVVCRNKQRVIDGGMDQADVTQNRPIAFFIDDKLQFAGVIEYPEFVDSCNEDATSIVFKCIDKHGILINEWYRDPKVMDKMLFTDAVIDTLADAVDMDTELDADVYTLPDYPPLKDHANAMYERGKTVSQGLKHLFEAYAGTWLRTMSGKADGFRFRAGPVSWWEAKPAVKVFWTIGAARDFYAADDYPDANAFTHIYRSFKSHKMPLEANFVKVTGVDAQTGEPIEVFKQDTASMDPTTSKVTRPINWVGQPRPYGVVTKLVRHLDVGERAVNLLFDRKSVVYEGAQITSRTPYFDDDGYLQVRHDMLDLSDHGDGWRIVSGSIQFKRTRNPEYDTDLTNEMFSGPSQYIVIRKVPIPEE